MERLQYNRKTPQRWPSISADRLDEYKLEEETRFTFKCEVDSGAKMKVSAQDFLPIESDDIEFELLCTEEGTETLAFRCTKLLETHSKIAVLSFGLQCTCHFSELYLCKLCTTMLLITLSTPKFVEDCGYNITCRNGG